MAWRHSLLFLLFWVNFERSSSQRNSQLNELISDAELAKDFIRRYEFEASSVCNSIMTASWNYQTNLTTQNQQILVNLQLQGADFNRKKLLEASNYDWRALDSPTLRRIFSIITVSGPDSLSDIKREEYSNILQEMISIYTTSKICQYVSTTGHRLLPSSSSNGEVSFPQQQRLVHTNNGNGFISSNVNSLENDGYDDYDNPEYNGCLPTLKLEPDLQNIMSQSRNPDELAYVWRAFRTKVARPLRRRFIRVVQLANEAAQNNGFHDAGSAWRSSYEDPNFERNIQELWDQVKPLYEQLHAFVRKKLMLRYGEHRFYRDGTIPAHLLGNMWAQNWKNILDLTVPYSNRTFPDVTENMRSLGMTPRSLFRLAESFFLSLGFEPLTDSFWRSSIFQKPLDRDIVCQASSWDFCNKVDYRIKQCTEITMDDFIKAHHEMGHIHYFKSYRELPLVFRNGANAGFQEAVGEAIALSVSTPTHLQTIGLLPPFDIRYEDNINFLFSTALEKVAFLPFGYLVDQWRWKVFRGDITEWNLNLEWWKMRSEHQGVSAPFTRTEKDFDPGSKFHIATHTPYIRYFVGHILQFQIHEELCHLAGHRGKLYQCDIHQSIAAGKRLREVLRMGKSRPWQEVLLVLTGGKTNRLDARPMLRYFADLEDWLRNENIDEHVGWALPLALALQTPSSAEFISIIVAMIIAVVALLCLCIVCIRKKCYCRSHKIDRIA